MWKIFQKPGVLVGIPDYIDPSQLGDLLRLTGFGWVAVKVLQGTAKQDYNIDWLTRSGWPQAMRTRGITFGLWGYHMTDPAAEAKLASDLIGQFDDAAHSTFYIADCEAEYTSWGGEITRSAAFVKAFRALRPSRPAALTSYGGATLDNNLSSVFDYRPWQQSQFDFLPQCYFQQAAELEPAHCIEQAVTAGWGITEIHPIVASYSDTLGRMTGAQNGYLLRNCKKRFGIQGYSVFNGENMGSQDYADLQQIVG